jgi:hypothetical protein
VSWTVSRFGTVERSTFRAAQIAESPKMITSVAVAVGLGIMSALFDAAVEEKFRGQDQPMFAP